MSETAPSKRWSLRGYDEEGNEVLLIRNFGRKLYRCPACRGDIPIGTEHTVVQYVFPHGDTEHHHWHRRCVEELLIQDLRDIKKIPAAQSSQSRFRERDRRRPR